MKVVVEKPEGMVPVYNLGFTDAREFCGKKKGYPRSNTWMKNRIKDGRIPSWCYLEREEGDLYQFSKAGLAYVLGL